MTARLLSSLALMASAIASAAALVAAAPPPASAAGAAPAFAPRPQVGRPAANPAELVYSTYLGGSATDQVTAVAVGPDGHIYVAGHTYSTDFPTTANAYQRSHRGNEDVFVARFDPATSTPVYITLLGGRATDQAFGLAVDAAGAAYVTGWTGPGNFPRTPGVFDNTGAGLWEGFVSKLSPDGSRLEYSTFLGGQETDWPRAICVDSRGAAVVVGHTTSPDFPVTPDAFDATCGADGACSPTGPVETWDVFAVRINPTATALEYGTFLGGSSDDYAYAVALGGDGRLAVAGRTWSADFPVTAGAHDTSYGGSGDGYVAVLRPHGTALHYVTFLEASAVYALALDGRGAAYVAGQTSSAAFPATPGAFDTSYGGGMCGSATSPYRCRDGFVARFSPDGSALEYATFLGGNRDDIAYGLALAADGVAYVTGSARSADFPSTPDSYDPTFNGHFSLLCEDGDVCPDVFVAGIAADGAALAYGAFVGVKEREWGAGIALGPEGRLVVGGVASANFPTTAGAYDRTHNGGRDGFALVLAPRRSIRLFLPLWLAAQGG